MTTKSTNITSKPFKTFTINVHHKAVRPLTDVEFARLKADVKENGIQTPVIVTAKGVVVDGHHRIRAAKELKIPMASIPWSLVKGDADPAKVAESVNIARRHMTNEELQAFVDKGLEAGDSVRDIAKKTGASKSKVGRAAAKSTAAKTTTVKGQTRTTAAKKAAAAKRKAAPKVNKVKALVASYNKLNAAEKAEFFTAIMAIVATDTAAAA